MRLRRTASLGTLALLLVGCATVSRPSVAPPPTLLDSVAEDYRSADDAPVVLESIDQRLSREQKTAADLPTPDLQTYSQLLLAAGRLDEADQALGLLSARTPKDHGVLLSLALLAGARGDPEQEERIAALEAAFPGDPDAADLRARWLLSRGDRVGAEAAWKASLQSRESAGALMGLAELALRAKKPQDALGYADRAVAAAPDDDQTWSLRARVRTQLDRSVQAKADLDRAVTLAPDNPWHRYDRGRLSWLKLYDGVGAKADLEFAVAHDPENFLGWALLGEVYEDQDQARPAYDAWTKALALRPDYRPAYPSAAMLSFRYRDFAKAAAYAKEAAKAYPGEYAFPFVEALSLRALGRVDEAKVVLEKARPRFPKGSTVEEMFRFLITPGSDYYLNTAMTKETSDSIRLRLRFYQGCYYALTQSANSARAAFVEVGESSLKRIPEIGAAREWLDHGL